ncbi:DUF7065 domain-containing protein [Parasphingopyxis marina]|uniref:DUF7065 domain-containing protein n=1 Tax=Parasphingopyxis marina TaxID=2761622 RepID=A0A842I0H1_9SPHN|nr:hypothetical protein [Parasphingopyxis marina]MBC2778986.1 hypothetical protein [Parasphingopyxis marina]
MIENKLLNPSNVDPVMELPHAAQDIPLWTEYCYFFGYDPEAQMGVSIHAGREPSDTSIWRATISIYLPGENLLVAKYCGRDGHARGAGAGPLRVTCVEPMRLWTVEFDGLCQATTRSASTNAAHPDSPSELVKFFLTFEGAAPFWDMNALMQNQSWASYHWEQICSIKGQLTVGGKTTNISAMGVRDHSSGPRDYGPLLSNFWVNALFPDGAALHGVNSRCEEEGTEIRMGYIFRNDGSPLENCELVELPHVCTLDTPAGSVARDPLTDPDVRKFRFVLNTKDGLEEVEGELLHTASTTYLSPNDELLGTDFTQLTKGQPKASQLAESPARFTWRGQTGYGGVERIARLVALK